MPLRPGDPAPDVDLPGWHDGQERRFRLSDHRGAPVVLAFYPGDDTPVCRRQLCSYSDGLDELTATGAHVWGISAQDVASHRRFAEARRLRLPLLADVDRTAVRAYGVGGPLGLVKRSVFVVDADGRLAWSHVSALGLTYQDVDALRAVLDSLEPAA
ncbi:MAG TPA: peroxiredoxin [Mycobacteriales bacterium]|nr:peroxiredoxin [Mycobacteriales bacterium]